MDREAPIYKFKKSKEMSTNDENWFGNAEPESKDNSEEKSGFNREDNGTGKRVMRPRFNRPAGGSDYHPRFQRVERRPAEDAGNRYRTSEGGEGSEVDGNRYQPSYSGDRPQRPYGDRPQRPYGDRPQRPYGDRPQRPYGDRPQRPYGDRPQRPYDNDRQQRPYDNDRPQRPYGDRPQRPYGDRPQRPYDNDRQQRPYGDRPQRPYGDRPQRPYGDRPQRPYGDRPQRPYRPYGDNPQQGGFRPRYPQGGRTPYDANAKYSHKKQIEYKEVLADPNEPIRLNKYLANAGICSRREADEYITAGVVTVNGTVVTELGTKVKRSDTVMFHDQTVNPERKIYILLNKPKDCVTTVDDPQERKTVMDFVKDACKERIYPVGRLDRNTTGVLLLTNDGELASKLTHPKFLKKKIYHVYCDKNVARSDMDRLVEGIDLDDGDKVQADEVNYASETDKSQVGIEIHSGKNRVVRRMFEALGYRVIKLDRVQFAGLTKKNLRRGDWRFLTEKEVDMLRMGAFE